NVLENFLVVAGIKLYKGCKWLHRCDTVRPFPKPILLGRQRRPNERHATGPSVEDHKNDGIPKNWDLRNGLGSRIGSSCEVGLPGFGSDRRGRISPIYRTNR